MDFGIIKVHFVLIPVISFHYQSNLVLFYLPFWKTRYFIFVPLKMHLKLHLIQNWMRHCYFFHYPNCQIHQKKYPQLCYLSWQPFCLYGLLDFKTGLLLRFWFVVKIFRCLIVLNAKKYLLIFFLLLFSKPILLHYWL